MHRISMLALITLDDVFYVSFQDIRMVVQSLLDLPRVDVFSSPDDHVLDPAYDLSVAVLVNHGLVS